MFSTIYKILLPYMLCYYVNISGYSIQKIKDLKVRVYLLLTKSKNKNLLCYNYMYEKKLLVACAQHHLQKKKNKSSNTAAG